MTANEPPTVLDGHTASHTSLSLSPDGLILASTNHDSTIRLWDLDANEELAVLHGHHGASWSSVFSPNGDMLASIGIDMQVRLWNLATLRQVSTFAGHDFEFPGFQMWNQLRVLRYSADGKKLFSAASDEKIRVWDIEKMIRLEHITLSGHPGWLDSLDFTIDSTKLISRSRSDDKLICWNVDAGVESWKLADESSIVPNVGFSPDGRTVAIPKEANDGVLLFDMNDKKEIGRIRGVTGLTTYSPDGSKLAVSGSEGIQVRDLENNSVLLFLPKEVRTNGRPVYLNHAFSPNGKLFANNRYPNIIEVRSTSNFEVVYTAKVPEAFGVTSKLLFVPNNDNLLLVRTTRGVELWDVESGSHAGHMEHLTPIWEFAVSPDGKTVATASHDGNVRLWSIPLRQVVAKFEAHDGSAVGVAFSPDGSKLASCGSDGKIRIWRSTLR